MLRAMFTRRAGFWRALVEMTLLATGITLAYYPFHWLVSSPWSELISVLSLGIYGFAAWKLVPGVGGFWRRAGRTLSWLLLFILLNGLIGWALLTLLPWKTELFGASFDARQLGLAGTMLNTAMVIASLFVPARLALAVWTLGRRRLRWRLTFSYLLIGVLTNLFTPIALFGYLAVLSLATVPALIPPAELAPTLTTAITPALRSGITPAELDALLDGILAGDTRLPLPHGEQLSDVSDLTTSGVRRLTLLAPDRSVIASAGLEAPAVGASLPSATATNLRLLLDTAAAGDVCREGNPAEGPIADTAVCPIRAEDGAPLGLLVVESNLDGAAQVGAAFGRLIRVTLLGFSLTLPTVVLVAVTLMPVALGVGYLLARGLTGRIERLTEATAGITAGDLSRRVDIGRDDEIGQLGEHFNVMAAQLAGRERDLAESAARSQALLRANKRLVADVSHELRNPLATLRGYLEALEQQYGRQLPADDMRVIQGEMARLTALVDDLFTLARAEAQQLPLTMAPVDAGALVERLAETLAPLARRERQIELVCQVERATPRAHADAARLEQVVRNLAQNALRYTPPGGIVALAVAPSPDGAPTVVVADTGVGIDPEDLPHVFERFYRGDSSRARETGGAGLGLSLVHELVTAMGGTVRVESEPGRGSRFTVTLRGA